MIRSQLMCLSECRAVRSLRNNIPFTAGEDRPRTARAWWSPCSWRFRLAFRLAGASLAKAITDHFSTQRQGIAPMRACEIFGAIAVAGLDDANEALMLL